MISFYDGFAEMFPEISELEDLWSDAQVAEEITIPDAQRKPSPYVRSVPKNLALDANALSAMGAAVGMHPDEIAIVIDAAIKNSENTLILDAFKKLFSVTKLCTDVNEALATNRQEELESWEACEEDFRCWRKSIKVRNKLIKDKEKKITATKDAHRRAWLALVRDLEARFKAVGRNTKKLSEADAALYARAKRGTKKGEPFTFLRNQKGEKCAQILKEVRSDLRRKMHDRGVRNLLKRIKGNRGLEEILKTLDNESANDLFDAYVRRTAFVHRPDGYFDLDPWIIGPLLSVGDRFNLKSCDGWRAHIQWREKQKEDIWRRHEDLEDRYGTRALRAIYDAVGADAEF
jgi:hypothetical protein